MEQSKIVFNIWKVWLITPIKIDCINFWIFGKWEYSSFIFCINSLFTLEVKTDRKQRGQSYELVIIWPFSYSNSSKTTIIKKLCKSKNLSNDRVVIQKNPLQITSDLQRVFPYDHSVIWQVFLICKAFDWWWRYYYCYMRM